MEKERNKKGDGVGKKEIDEGGREEEVEERRWVGKKAIDEGGREE